MTPPSTLGGATVLVTGGHGFLGRVVCRHLEAVGAYVTAPTHADLELRDPTAVQRGFHAVQPDVVVHLAARVGGIGANQRKPATFWRDNLLMGVNVLDASHVVGARRVVVLGTVCSYPKHPPAPFREDALWDGYPEETNAPYGIAKRALWTGLASYAAEFGLASAYLLPANLYGPDDDFDLERSHVIPAMIRKCEAARLAGVPEVLLWGTGRPTREFLFVEDAADAIVRAATKVNDPTPINVGTGHEISMETLAHRVAAITDFTGVLRWDPRRPDGQPRRVLDTSRARDRLGWTATTSLDEGLAKTVAWYRTSKWAAADEAARQPTDPFV